MIFSIEQEATAPNGAVVFYHEVTSANIAPDGDAVVINMGSWATKQARIEGHAPVSNIQYRVLIGTLPKANKLIKEISDVVVAGGWLAGGKVDTDDPTTDPKSVKDRKWAKVKAQRELMEYSGFTWSTRVFDSDPKSQEKIQAAAISAIRAISSNRVLTRTWTLKNNSTITLTAEEILLVAEALDAHIEQTHAWGRTKRAEIYGDET